MPQFPAWGTTTHYPDHNVVDTSGASGGGGIAEAPTDGATYGRVNATWAPIYDKYGALLANNNYIYLRSPFVGDSASLIASTGGKSRWTVAFINQDAESGGNTGSNFQISRWNDTGPPPAVCMIISRATGIASFVNGINLPPTTNAAPVDGDLWYDGTHLNFYHGGTTTELV